MANSSKRFRVAFSFAGEKRDYVAHMASLIAARFGERAVLYDKYHEAEFANVNLGFELPDLYRDESDLIVVVVCPHYSEKDWCGLEWRAIQGMLIARKSREIMFCRFEFAKLQGLYENTGYVELDHKTPAEAVALILERLALNEDKPKDFYKGTPAKSTDPNLIPTPPAFYAEPAYIGSHDFVGRAAQLDTLSDWAAPADAHPILLFEAIGGTGKSMLTWEWTTKHAAEVRSDWAGRFWYSFYEKGAIMADFCRRALAYMTGQPVEAFQKRKTADLSVELLHHLQARPWLLILDGLERVLVAYHRYDAAQLADEQVDTAKDQIAQRDPCSAIRPEDDELLRMLAAAAPSKLLITTRLTPRVLVNASGQGIQGVLRVPLPGLRPADAEQLFRACGVTGNSQAIQNYLKSHCDCHPLVTGVLAGLVIDYLPDRGNFDAWAADSTGGGMLDLANLDLVQKRTHILYAALAALPDSSRQLLGTLALLSEAVDFQILDAFNPHLPPTRQALTDTVRDLERRGLLQYDHQSKRWDLHPVVRAVAAGRLEQAEKERYGQRVVDYFSQQKQIPYEDVAALEDVSNRMQIVRTLLQMGRYEEAYDADLVDLQEALLHNLEAYAEILSLLGRFFPYNWDVLPNTLSEYDAGLLATYAVIALQNISEYIEAQTAFNAILLSAWKWRDWMNVYVTLSNMGPLYRAMNRLAIADRLLSLSNELTFRLKDNKSLFRARLLRFAQLAELGRYTEAEAHWQLLDPMGRIWSGAFYRPGDAEDYYARFKYYQGTLTEEHLAHAEQLAIAGKNRMTIRRLYSLRGQWQLDQRQWAFAAESLSEAVRMAREVGQPASEEETMLALAKFHQGQLPDAREEAERLSNVKNPPNQALAYFWLALGDRERAKEHALAAYKWAWADGEPFVHRHELNKAKALLEELGVKIPNLPPYDPAKDEKFPWEDELAAEIARMPLKETDA